MSSARDSASRYQLLGKGSFNFELVQAPKTTPNDDEVLVKIKAIALNPVDWKQLLFGLFVESYPTVLGCEGAGVVEAVGSGVTRFKPGDEVFGRFDPANDRTGAYQEYAVASEARLARKSSSISFEDAASLPIGFGTALGVIHLGLGVPVNSLVPGTKPTGNSPKTILVLGGSSVVGAASIQVLRKLSPTTTIIATSSATHHERLKQLGASAAFSQSSTTLVSDIRAATPDATGVDAILDAVNGLATQPELFEALNPSGLKLIAEVPTGQNLKQAPEGVQHKLAGAREMDAVEGGANVYDVLGELVQKGQWQLPVKVDVAGRGLESISGALQKLKAGVSGTKIVVAV